MDPNTVKRAVVVGAGVMGHSIAQVFAQSGIEVGLVDLDNRILSRATGLIRSNLETLSGFGLVSSGEIPAIESRIHISTDLAAAAKGVDFAIEAVVEVPDVKKKIFHQLEESCPQDAVLASNTSSLDVFRISQVKRPQRMVVAHWFAPPHIIPLVEVVPGPDTSPEVVFFTAGLMKRLGKKTVIMREFVPSFIVNRIQLKIAEAVWEMIEKGWATPEEIDLAVKLSLGIRLPIVGVVQTSDFSGLDLLLDIMKSRGDVNKFVEEKVRKGHLGAKTSKGIYDYGDRTEAEILKKRDERYLKMLDQLERINAFEAI
jgi:3-hydroxybutyryl-CoA dehydrogenase